MSKKILRLIEKLLAITLTGGIVYECAITLIDPSQRLPLLQMLVVVVAGIVAATLVSLFVFELIKGEK